MIYFDSRLQSSEYIFSKITDEADSNFIRILYYLHNDFQYQCRYFETKNTIFFPGIYRIKNNTFYIFQFNIYFQSSAKRKQTLNEVLKLYPNIKFKIYSLR